MLPGNVARVEQTRGASAAKSGTANRAAKPATTSWHSFSASSGLRQPPDVDSWVAWQIATASASQASSDSMASAAAAATAPSSAPGTSRRGRSPPRWSSLRAENIPPTASRPPRSPAARRRARAPASAPSSRSPNRRLPPPRPTPGACSRISLRRPSAISSSRFSNGHFGVGANHARRQHPMACAVALDYAVTGSLRAAIDAEDAHVMLRAPPTPSRRYRSWSRRSARRRALPALRSDAAWRRRSCLPA